MKHYQFTVFTIQGELDLNRLGSQLGLSRKYRWEEPMLLNPLDFKVLTSERIEAQQVYLYYFGGIVFLNCTAEVISDFARDMAKIADAFRNFPNPNYHDDYSLRIEGESGLSITNDYAVMPRYDLAFMDIIAFVIAKSVALERIEAQVDTVFDEMEGMIGLLDQGKLSVPDKRLAKLASKILNFKYRSISSIMVLDKPEITWDNLEADRLYLTMANLFELNHRYQEIKHKSETLMDITEVFTGLSHARRASRLEWIIIVLIFIEIVIYMVQIMK
jgi:required for meiotic nuclear division protein 1